ncbi:MAG: ribbon-helix-helix protein, CopG family [Candidatus Rokubacteria bacterium]|nr:ribbon-helix-helix protein, CopG family [Candidatus Rokubacteria bacterium]
MPVAKVALSLPSPLLIRIDRLARKAGLSRSALVRQVMETAFQRPTEAEVVRKAKRLYAEIGEDDRALSETFLTVAAETLRSFPKRRRR